MSKNIIDKTFQRIYGQPCWGLHYERLLNLTMSFGQPLLNIREPYKSSSKSKAVQKNAARRVVTVKGQWWLWIYVSYWRLSSEDVNLATGASSLQKIEQAMRQLDGQKLESVQINPSTGATRFNFDLGCMLDCRRMEKDCDDELWTLFKPNKYVLSVYGNGSFRHTLANLRPPEVEQHLRRIEDGGLVTPA